MKKPADNTINQQQAASMVLPVEPASIWLQPLPKTAQLAIYEWLLLGTAKSMMRRS